MSHMLLREDDLDKDKEEPDSLMVLSVDLTGPFTMWYETAASQLGRGWFSVSCSKFCGSSLVGMVHWPISGESTFCSVFC